LIFIALTSRNQLHPERSSLTAYVRFQTIEEAEDASSKLNGATFHDHHLRADVAHRDSPKEKKLNNKHAVFVGNLYFSMFCMITRVSQHTSVGLEIHFLVMFMQRLMLRVVGFEKVVLVNLVLYLCRS